jgi:5-(hydroxymethyl)furfural/furfural oxidase
MVSRIEMEWLIVGGGSAGCVLAARLSEDPTEEVMLLEAGPDWRASDAPPQLRSLNGWRALDESACAAFQWQGLESRRTHAQEPRPHVRGRGLGGGSTVNGMMAIRAIPDDYDRWAALGCPGWSYAEMLPYLRRMESDADFGDRPYHGSDGPIPVQRLPRSAWGPADNALADAALGLGYPWCEDHNAPTATGVSPFGLNARDGARVTTNDAYLEPVRERANLRVLGGANVDRVIVEAGRAVGVRARVGNDWIEVRAERVVLCGGAIHSPSILLRSGIGPDGPIAQLPVGQGMQEHPLALLWLFPRPAARPDLDARQANCLVRYSSELEGAGANDMFVASVNQTLAMTQEDPSHLVMDSQSGTWGGAGGGQAAGGPGLLCVWANEERSRGWLELVSPDPDVAPRIEQRLLDDPGDLRRMRDGVKRCLELTATGAFDAAFEHIAIDPTGTGLEALSDDAAIDAWLMATVGDTGHICGTCRMGAPDDPRAVVEPHGRVLGLEGLWVADASVFPEVPRANTNLPTIAAAERLSDLIRDVPVAAPPERERVAAQDQSPDAEHRNGRRPAPPAPRVASIQSGIREMACSGQVPAASSAASS